MKTHEITVETGSMTPTIEAGVRVRFDHRRPSAGDVAVFLAQGRPMVHRVMAVWETRIGTFYIHKGDAGTQSGVFRDHELVGVVLEQDAESRSPVGWTALRLWFLGLVARVYGEVKGRSELSWVNKRLAAVATVNIKP